MPQAGKALDLPVYFGDAGSSAVLHSLGAQHAACAVITLDTPGVHDANLGINPRVPLSEPVSACGEATHVGMSWLPHQDCKQRMMCRSKLPERVGPTQALSQREDLRQGPRCHAWPKSGEGKTMIADLLQSWQQSSERGLSEGSAPRHQGILCSLHTMRERCSFLISIEAH